MWPQWMESFLMDAQQLESGQLGDEAAVRPLSSVTAVAIDMFQSSVHMTQVFSQENLES